MTSQSRDTPIRLETSPASPLTYGCGERVINDIAESMKGTCPKAAYAYAYATPLVHLRSTPGHRAFRQLPWVSRAQAV